jgi:hypothetical protein
MKDEFLLDDLKGVGFPGEKIDALRQSNILTYSRLLEALGDDKTEPELRVELCDALGSLRQDVDRRRALAPLLKALDSGVIEVRRKAALTLGFLHLKRAVPSLGKLARDNHEDYELRLWVIHALGMIRDARAIVILWELVDDETENLGLRTEALEQTVSYSDDEDKNVIPKYIMFLDQSSADLRFWASYCLGQIRFYRDISPALGALDWVAALDHTVPMYWGWHVDREALLPLEWIYFRAVEPEADKSPGTWVVSPAAEFDSFIAQFREWAEGGVHTTKPEPEITFQVDKDWLAAQLRERWPGIALDVRQPRPQAYLMDFQLTVQGKMLIGGLHRDGYALVLTGAVEMMGEFAAWYRGLIAPEQALFLYPWAESGIPLASGQSAQDIQNLITHHLE